MPVSYWNSRPSSWSPSAGARWNRHTVINCGALVPPAVAGAGSLLHALPRSVSDVAKKNVETK